MRTKAIFQLLIMGFLANSLVGQNGKLLHRELVTLNDSLKQRLSVVPNFQKALDSTQLYKITYESDGLRINGYLATPIKSGTYPVIIYNRGGNRDYGALNDLSASYLLRNIANWGYVVVASNYRGGGGSEGMEEFGGKDVNDIHNLLPILANVKKADSSRIGIYGWSRGGMMTYRVLAETCKFKAAIVGAGAANELRGKNERSEMEKYVYSQIIPNYENNKEEELKKRSAIYWTNKLCKTTPILLLHGSSDWRVSPKDALDMADSLYTYKHPFRLHFYEGGDHGLREYRKETNNAVKAFLDYYVRDEKKHPDMEPHGR